MERGIWAKGKATKIIALQAKQEFGKCQLKPAVFCLRLRSPLRSDLQLPNSLAISHNLLWQAKGLNWTHKLWWIMFVSFHPWLKKMETNWHFSIVHLESSNNLNITPFSIPVLWRTRVELWHGWYSEGLCMGVQNGSIQAIAPHVMPRFKAGMENMWLVRNSQTAALILPHPWLSLGSWELQANIIWGVTNCPPSPFL